LILAYSIPSVIEIWYTVGSLCIPTIILPVVSSYYPAIKVNSKVIVIEMITALAASTTWFFIRDNFDYEIYTVEPMLVGLFCAIIIHFLALLTEKIFSLKEIE